MKKWKLGSMAILALLLPALVFGQVGGGGSGGLTAPVALSSLDTQSAATIVGRASGAGTGVPVALTAAQTRAIIAPLPLTDVATQAEATIIGRASGAGTGVPTALTASQAGLIINRVRQVATKTIASKISGTTILPFDDTIPQNTEGVAWITSDSFTPTAADSIIMVRFHGIVRASTVVGMAWALFTDSVADAIDADAITTVGNTNYVSGIALCSKQAAANTTARTYSLRVGPGTAATIYNYQGTGDDFGGVSQLGTLTIWEIAP